MKTVIIILLTTFLLLGSFTNPFQKDISKNLLIHENLQQRLETSTTAGGSNESRTVNHFQLPKSMIRVYNGENQSVDVLLGAQENLTWINVGLSTIIKPSPIIEDKIDTNLFNLTGLIVKDYIHNNQTNVIISFSNSNTLLEKTNGWPVLETQFDEPHALYMSKNAFSSMRFLAARLNYSTIFELAKNPMVSHIWLDRKFHVCLDQSVRIIKDPLKWASLELSFNRRINGSGVKIAILDTGIDSTHPDFYFPNGTSKIVANCSFTGEPITDGYGHGTHCASIAAGTGAASAGQYVGVAPGAALLNVKVLNNNGEGLESWIISGIQWAVDNNANVLSMSFGSTDGGNGSDPLSTTVNWAVNQGAVCVVAAGNSGSEMYTVDAPGVAELAITVGASTKADVIADFSSRGPTSDYRIKPDVVAPGVDIVAARASGTSMGTPVSQYYTKASGTSMATPHVAGAAALLLDAHSSWSPIRVKMALANYARDVGGSVLDQGTGRIDACKATNASAVGNSNVSLGRVNLNTVSKQVFTIQNLANRTLSIALDAKVWHINDGTPYNVASMNTSRLILSNGATGKAELSLDTGGTLPEGYFEGRINATFGDAGIRIPFFFCIVSQVNVKATDESGSTLMAAFVLIDAQTGTRRVYSSECARAQFITLHGDYVVQAMNVYAWKPPNSLDTKISFLIHKKFSIGIGETISLQLSLASAYKLEVRTSDVQGSPLYLVCKQLLTPYYGIGYYSEIGTLTSQYIYLTNLAEYIKPPCFFGYEGFPQDDTHWRETGILTSEVDAYFIGWDLSKFGLSTIPSALNYTNSELATFNIENMLSKSSAVSTIWFNQIAGMWQSGVWYGYQTHPGIRWKTHVLPCQLSASWSELEWSCLYAFSTYPSGVSEYFVIDRHFQPITKGENILYSMGKTPLLPQDVIDDPPYCGSGLYVPYYPLRVEKNLFIAKTDMQATKRLEVFRNGYLISNETKAWAQTPIPISQFLNPYGLYSFVVKTETTFNYSSQNVAQYTINYTSTSTDLIPPSITQINCESCFTKNDHQVEIQLTDNDGISDVSLLYSTNNGPYLPSNLKNLGNNCFSANLTLPPNAQKLSLIIQASDGNGNKIRFKTDPAATRGYETRIDAKVNGDRITGKLTVIGGSLLQPVYLKVKSNGTIMYTLTDANGNFAFNVPPSLGFRIEIEMSNMGIYDRSSFVINFLRVQTEPAGIVSIPGEGWYIEVTDVVLTGPEYVHFSSNTHYRFIYWDVDGTSQGIGVNPITVRMNANHTATAHYITQYSVFFTQTGLSSDATGNVVTVNGNTKSFGDLPFTLWVDSGSSVTHSYNSMVSSTVSGKKFRLDSVTGPVSPITVSAPTTVTGNYKTQYYLTVRTDPTAIATIPGEGWYDGAASVTITAPPVKNYQFNYWDVDGASQGSEVNPITVSMNVAHTATAYYTPTPSLLHDIAITNETTLKNIVGQGFSTRINVTVTNQGNYSETFNVTVYANTTSIASQTVTLTSGNSTTITFTWNTTGFAKGNYTISAYVWPVQGETHTADNTFTDGWVIVAMVGDVTGPDGWPDGKCDIRDVALVAKLFGVIYPNPRYDPNCDLIYDGKIDIKDVARVAKNFGKTDP